MAIYVRPRDRLGQLTRNRLPALAQIAGLAAQVHVQPGHKEQCATHAPIVRGDPYNVNRQTRNIAEAARFRGPNPRSDRTEGGSRAASETSEPNPALQSRWAGLVRGGPHMSPTSGRSMVDFPMLGFRGNRIAARQARCCIRH